MSLEEQIREIVDDTLKECQLRFFNYRIVEEHKEIICELGIKPVQVSTPLWVEVPSEFKVEYLYQKEFLEEVKEVVEKLTFRLKSLKVNQSILRIDKIYYSSGAHIVINIFDKCEFIENHEWVTVVFKYPSPVRDLDARGDACSDTRIYINVAHPLYRLRPRARAQSQEQSTQSPQ